MGGTFRPEENLVVWLVQPDALAWPAVIIRCGENDGDWVLRLLGHDSTQLSPVRSEDMRDFSANLYYAFQAEGKMRAQMAIACAEAVELARNQGNKAQCKALSEPGFDSFVQSLTGKTELFHTPLKQIKLEESHIHIRKGHHLRDESQVVKYLQNHPNDVQKKLVKVREYMERWREEERHWNDEKNRFREEGSAAKMNHIEAESSLRKVEMQELSACNALQKEHISLIEGKKELQLRILYHRAAVAYLEHCRTASNPLESQVIPENSVNIAPPVDNKNESRKIKSYMDHSGCPPKNHETFEGSVLKLPLVPRSSRNFSLNDAPRDASSSSTPVRRKGKKIVVFGDLPTDNPYRRAASELGKRMLAYRGSTEDMSPSKRLRRDLRLFHKKHCIEGYSVPYSQGKEIDVFEVLRTVLKWGGYDAVKSGNGLGQLCDYVQVMRGSVRVLKKFYICFLYQYEQELALGIVPPHRKIQEMLSEMKNLHLRSRPVPRRLEN